VKGESQEVVVHGLSPLTLGLMAVCALSSVAVLASAVLQEKRGPVVFAIGFALIARRLYLRRMDRGYTRAVPTRLRVVDGNVEIEGRAPLLRGEIASAHVQPRENGSTVVRIRSHRRWKSVDIAVKDEAHGNALLEEIGHDASHAAARFSVRGGFKNKVLRGIVMVLTALGFLAFNFHAFTRATTVSSGFVALGVLVAFALLSNLVPTIVTIGADGVHISEIVGARFIPFAQIASIEPSVEDIHVTKFLLREGTTVELRSRPRRSSDLDETTRAIRARLEEGLQAFRDRNDASEAMTWLARGNRTTKEWLAALRGLTGDGSYRRSAIPEEHLWRIVEDPRADADARAGAVVALGENLDDASKQRVRRIALATAAPRVRVALDVAVSKSPDDPEVARAFEDLHADEPEGGPPKQARSLP
jgi:hypothetical protein